MLESQRNGGGRTVAIRSGGWRRGVGAAVAAGEGAPAPGAGARSWGGDESPIYGEAGGRIWQQGRGGGTTWGAWPPPHRLAKTEGRFPYLSPAASMEESFCARPA